VRYACIATHRAEYPVELMCRVLAVSRAGFYAWLRRPPCGRIQTDTRLRVAIRAIYAESRRSYGSPRIHRELRAQGERHGRKRVARLMRLEGLRAKRSLHRGLVQSAAPALDARLPESRRVRTAAPCRLTQVSIKTGQHHSLRPPLRVAWSSQPQHRSACVRNNLPSNHI
jgi:transposase InsO family protein